MAAWHLPGWATLARTAARGAAWATDVAAIVVLCFVAQKWTATCGAVAPGIIGVSIDYYYPHPPWMSGVFNVLTSTGLAGRHRPAQR